MFLKKYSMLHFILFLLLFFPYSQCIGMEIEDQYLTDPSKTTSTETETDGFVLIPESLQNNKSPQRKERRRSKTFSGSPTTAVLQETGILGNIDQGDNENLIPQNPSGALVFIRKQKRLSLGKPGQRTHLRDDLANEEDIQGREGFGEIVQEEDENFIPQRTLKHNARRKKGRSLGAPSQRNMHKVVESEEKQNSYLSPRTLQRKSSSRRNIFESSGNVVRRESSRHLLHRGLSQIMKPDEMKPDEPSLLDPIQQSPRKLSPREVASERLSPRQPSPRNLSPREMFSTRNANQSQQESRPRLQKRGTKDSILFRAQVDAHHNFEGPADFFEESPETHSGTSILSNREEEVSLSESALLMDEEPEEFRFALTSYIANQGSASIKEVLDRGFFNPPFSWPVFTGGVIGTICGLAPSTPVTGMLMYLTGNFLNLPIGEWTNFFPISTTMITLTPIYMRQFYERGRIIAACLSCYKEYEGNVTAPIGGTGAEYIWKIGYKYSCSHHSFNSLAFFSAAVRSLCFTGIMVVAEANFPVVRGITGPFFFLSFLDQYYSLAKSNLMNAFDDKEPEGHFSYKNPQDKDVEMEDTVREEYRKSGQFSQQLLLMVLEYQKTMEKNDELVKESFQRIKDECDILKGTSLNPKKFFALSALLLKPRDYEETPQILTSTLTNKSPLAQVEDFLSYMYILSKGGGLIVRPIIIEYMLERVGTDYLGFSVNGAVLAACIGAGVELGAKIVTEYKSIRDYSSLRISFADLSRPSLARVLTFPCAGFFTIAGIYLGWENMSRWGTPALVKGGMLTSFVVEDLPPHSKFLAQKLDEVITASVTTVPECIGRYIKPYMPHCITSVITRCTPTSVQNWLELYNKRSWLRKWSRDLYASLEETFDAVTIASVYMTTQLEENYEDTYYNSVTVHDQYSEDDSQAYADSSSQI